MNILYLTHGCPYPPNKGDRIRNFHFLKHLAQRHTVTLAYPSFSAQDVAHADSLKSYCSSILTVRLSSTMAKLRCCLSLLRRQPLTNPHFYSGRLHQLIRQQSYDLVLVDCSSMAQYVRDIQRPKIIDFVDVDSDKWRLYTKMTPFPKSLIYEWEHRRLKDYEAELINEFDASVVISEKEKECLPESDRLFVVGNGINLEYFTPREKYDQNTMIFTGAMDYFPNIDAVLFFYEQVFPLIKKDIPSAKFIIGGMNPVDRIRALQSDDVLVTGFVPDMREYLGQATVCVAPLRIAKGVQNKVLEAMAMKVPVVSTSHANFGIQARHRQEILEVDEPHQFAKAVVELLQSKSLREHLADKARTFVENQFSWEHNLQILDDAISTAYGCKRKEGCLRQDESWPVS